MPLIGYLESCDSPPNMLYPIPYYKEKTIMTEFLFWKYFIELIGQLVVSAKCHYFNSKLFNIFSEDVVRDGDVFGLKRYILWTVENLRHTLLSS